MIKEKELTEKNADLLKAIANPVRLCIIKSLLDTKGCTVTNLQSCTNCSQSTLSQHVGKLKSIGIIKGERFGKEIIYRIVNEDIIRIITILFK